MVKFCGLLVLFVVCWNGVSVDSASTDRILKSLVKWTINVQLAEPLKPYEKVGISGDTKFLGSWLPNKAVFLNSTASPTKWTGSIQVTGKSTVNYRLFIGLVDSTGAVQVRKWETHMDGRTVNLGARSMSTNDRFGVVKNKTEVHEGWLNSGNILQFKLFRNPIQLEEDYADERIFVKVNPIDMAKQDETAPPQQSTVEVARFEFGNTNREEQPENGVPVNNDDVVIFHITNSELRNVAYEIILSTDDGNRIGFAYIDPTDIDSSEGIINLDINNDEDDVLGTMKVRYLLVKPLPTPQLYLKNTFVDFWRNHWRVKDIAHRGIRNALNIAPLTENTIAAIKEADIEGADMIETDVQLTKDLVPIIYHNYQVYTYKKASGTPKTKDDLDQVLLKNLTYAELMSLTTYEIIDSEIRKYQPQNSEPRFDLRKFPRLEDLLTQVNHTLGFDIELKYPQALYSGELESTQTIDMNKYVDVILNMVLRKGCGRLTILTSVSADICTMLQFKQNMYPVVFTGPISTNFYEDPRSDNLKQMINNAQAMNFMGIVANTYNFMGDDARSNIKLATDQDIKMFIYGDHSNSTRMVKYFKGLNPSGVIYPRVDLWVQDEEENVYEKDGDLPEYFDRQCLY